VGNKVLFGKYSGTEIRIDGEDVLILREDEVWPCWRSRPK
jgi:chaperonin GroES